MTTSLLDGIRRHSTVVADTADFLEIARYQPQDATTNPSLILKAVTDPRYGELVKQVCLEHRGQSLAELCDRLLVRFGCEILGAVPGRVSTEVDARLSFDSEATIERALRLMSLYARQGVPRARILIKIAATWQGIEAARQLERQGIRCNLTLVFGLHQAVACAEASVRLISPFVGRIYDWHKARAGAQWSEAENAGSFDPGVRSVQRIYAQYKRFDVPTEIMAASFRNVGQITALAGCDLMTISPDLLKALDAEKGEVSRQLDPAACWQEPLSPMSFTMQEFDSAHQSDAMAREKLAEGISKFSQDAMLLDAVLESQLATC